MVCMCTFTVRADELSSPSIPIVEQKRATLLSSRTNWKDGFPELQRQSFLARDAVVPHTVVSVIVMFWL